MLAIELRQKRAGLVTQARGLIDRAEAEKREMTAEESTQWDALHADADKLKGDIDRLERQERVDAEMRSAIPTIVGGRENGPAQGPNDEAATQERSARQDAWRSWIRGGIVGMTPEQRSVMQARQQGVPPEARALGVALDTAGGFLVDEGFTPMIETALAAYAGVRNTRATIMRTNTGADIAMPTSNDTSNSGELLNENVAASEQDITVGAKVLRSYMFSSKLIRVSLQFLQDCSVTQIEQWLAARLGERIGRALATYYISGTGSNQPEGLANAATLGKTGASQTAVTYDELVDLEHSVDMAYRRQAEFLLSDGVLKAMKKLKDGEGRPLWVPGMATREPDTIMGYRYTVDMGIPTPATTVKSIYFGDFSKFILRDVTGAQMLRLTERYAEYLQVGFLLFERHDSMLLDAGTHPIKYFAQA